MPQLTDEQQRMLKRIYLAKGDALEATIAKALVARGYEDAEAQAAAKRCANKVWRNSAGSGAAAGVLLGTVFTPVVGAIAGSSFGSVVGYHTFLHSSACGTVREGLLDESVELLNMGH